MRPSVRPTLSADKTNLFFSMGFLKYRLTVWCLHISAHESKAAYHLTNQYTYTASTDIPTTGDCVKYYNGVFVRKLKDSAVKATTSCQELFNEADLRVELIEDLSLKVDSVGTCNTIVYVCTLHLWF